MNRSQLEMQNQKENGVRGDFPCGPVVKTLPSNIGEVDFIPGGELRSCMPHAQKAKT